MSDKFTFNSAGQVHELEMAMDRVGGWDSRLVKMLCVGNNLGLVREILRGFFTVTPIEHLIDCDADPFIPSYLKEVVSHQRGGRFVFDPTKIKLHLSMDQTDGKYIKGTKLQKELTNEPVLNANVLDYLLDNPIIIPDEWKGKYIFFWGTVYRVSNGRLYVRCLCFDVGEWRSHYCWLDNAWFGDNPAAVRAS